ncbi:MAG TPA: O-antigen ligase family protein [Gaiellaceae bacterium]|nr:O-antigen ligase family protein [Gaiellaceae bacterium]
MTQLIGTARTTVRAPFQGVVAFAIAAVAIPLVCGALVARSPLFPIAILVGIGGVYLAVRSIVFPVALTGLPSLLIGLYGSNPLPGKVVFAALTLWLLLGLALAFLSGAWPASALDRRLLTPPLALVAALTVLLVARLDSGAYPTTKIELYLAQCVPVIVAGVLIGLNARSFRLYVLIAFAVAAANAVLLVYRLGGNSATQVYSARFSISTTYNPIWAGRSAAEGVLIALALTLGSFSRRTTLLGYVMLPLLGAALLASGSRGPVVGLLAALVVLVALTVTDRRLRSRLGRIAVGVTAAVVAAALIVPSSAFDRSVSFLLGDTSGLSSNGRTELWSKALSLFGSHFFTGVGTGGFSNYAASDNYPHNILLEAGAELGVVGLTIVVLLLFVSLRTAFRAWSIAPDQRERILAALVASLLVAATVNSLLSGGIESTDEIFLVAGLAYGLVVRYLRDGRRAVAQASSA